MLVSFRFRDEGDGREVYGEMYELCYCVARDNAPKKKDQRRCVEDRRPETIR